MSDVVTIEAVERPAEVPAALHGGGIDSPQPGGSSDTYSFNVCGWAHGRDQRVVCFRVLDGTRIAAEVPPNVPLPEAAAAGDGGRRSGEGSRRAGEGAARFQVLVRAIEMAPSFEIDVVAVLEDGSCESLGRIRGRRRTLRLPGDPALNPLMLTTIGRSGSKWLAWLLSRHPAIVAFQPLVFEPRVATYWAAALRALSAPRSYLRQIHTDHWEQQRWWLGDGTDGLPAPVELDMAQWLGVDAVHDLAAFCRQRTEAFYREAASRGGKHEARYFVEKFLLDPVLLNFTLESFPGAREVILVRDFRDRLSSVFAWNERRGEHGFGHEQQMSRAQYLADRVLLDAQQLLQRWRSRGADAHLVRYEDLVREPAATLSALLDHIGAPADPDTVKSLLAAAAAPSEMLDSHRTVMDPNRTIGRWRRDLPSELAEQANQVLAPVLAAFGYTTEPVEVGSDG